MANVGIFLLPWLVLVGATAAVIHVRESLPLGLLPFAVIVLTELFVAYCVMLAVALVTESEGWTIFAIVMCNLSLNLFLYWVSHMPSVADSMTGPVAVWSGEVIWLLAAEILAILVLLALTFWLQTRKRDFL